MKTVFIIMTAVLLCCAVTIKSGKFDLLNIDSTLIDKTPVPVEKIYYVHMYSGGVNIAAYQIKSWRIGIDDDYLHCIAADDKEVIIKGDWIITEE
jgi:hypothetical protein